MKWILGSFVFGNRAVFVKWFTSLDVLFALHQVIATQIRLYVRNFSSDSFGEI